jgi:hypothetical protein
LYHTANPPDGCPCRLFSGGRLVGLNSEADDGVGHKGLEPLSGEHEPFEVQ